MYISSSKIVQGELVNTDDDDADEEFDGDFEDDLSADSYEDEE